MSAATDVRDTVVGVDGSAASERAIDLAVVDAARSGSRVRLVHAWTPPDLVPGGTAQAYVERLLDEPAEQRARLLLEEVHAKALTRLAGAAGVEVVTDIRHGDPGRALVEAARTARLVVLGGPGRGPLAGALLGTSTRHVLHHAACPVLVVPPDGPPAAPPRRVVVGVDGSPSSRAALGWGAEAAVRHGCRLVAVHAWRTDSVPAHAPMRFMAPAQEYRQAAAEWLDAELAHAIPADPPVDVEPLLVHRVPAWGLLETTAPDDLLVVGSRGHGPVVRLLLGSVSTRCCSEAAAPVVVVHAPGLAST